MRYQSSLFHRACLLAWFLCLLAAVGAHASNMESTGGTVLIQSTVGGLVIGLDEANYSSGDGVVDRIFFFQMDQQERNLFFYGTAELQLYGNGMLIRDLDSQRAWRLQVEGRPSPSKRLGERSQATLLLGTELVSTEKSFGDLSLSQVQSHLQARADELGYSAGAFKNHGPFHDDTSEPCLGSSDPFCASGGGSGGGHPGSCAGKVVACSKSCADGSQCSVSCSSGKFAKCKCVVSDPPTTYAGCSCHTC